METPRTTSPGSPSERLATAATWAGQALDLYGYMAFSPNIDVQMGYSWFWYGTYIDQTTPLGDSSQFYVQTSLRY